MTLQGEGRLGYFCGACGKEHEGKHRHCGSCGAEVERKPRGTLIEWGLVCALVGLALYSAIQAFLEPVGEVDTTSETSANSSPLQTNQGQSSRAAAPSCSQYVSIRFKSGNFASGGDPEVSLSTPSGKYVDSKYGDTVNVVATSGCVGGTYRFVFTVGEGIYLDDRSQYSGEFEIGDYVENCEITTEYGNVSCW